MGDNSPDRRSGCGLLNAVFGRRTLWPRRSTSSGSLSAMATAGNNLVRVPSTPKRRRSGSDESSFFGTHPKAPDQPKIPSAEHHHQTARQNYDMKSTEEAIKIIPPPEQIQNNKAEQNTRQQIYPKQQQQQQRQQQQQQGRKVPREAIGISGELEIMIADHQKNSKGSNNLVRASSSNVMLFGNLGNLRQGGGGGGVNSNSYAVLDHLPKTAREETQNLNGKYPNSVMGNVVKNQPPSLPITNNNDVDQTGNGLCRALSTRMDPEQLKIMGNEDYKNGNFAEALALYDAAISIDPNKASYRSNKSAALTALGRILEAVFECREALRIEPNYHRAHHRIANLYIRLGDSEQAMYHYKQAGPEADNVDITKAKTLQIHLNKCTEARRLRDWNTLIKETRAAIFSGADSAPQMYALQAEALIKLNKHQEADQALTKGPNFNVDDCTKFFGSIFNANLLMVQAQVGMSVGRFDEALEAAQKANRLDPNNKEANMVMRKARAVATARSTGNQLFKAGKFYEACNVYGEGLENDPYNSVLLCNRAACRSKLGQFEKAVEDCTVALNVRPAYSKARLRRADCYAKLEKWEASIQDYEVLHKESPENEEVSKGLLEAKTKLKKVGI